VDGILSQDEINALLNGMDLSDSGSSDADTKSTEIDQSILSDIEKDAIGEVANISMGTSATTLFSLVNRKVNITTPVVSLATWDTLIDDYEKPCVFIQIKYTEGLDGSNILILKEQDVKIITDLMMGGDGTNTDGELGELHLSAISEAMNQMMGSSATSLSSMLGKMIDISPPQASLINLNEFKNAEDIAGFLTDTFVRIGFRMQIGDLVDSTILQLYPIEFARSLYETFINQQMGGMAEEPVKITAASGWKHTWKNLPDNVEYKVDEVKMEGYFKKVTHDASGKNWVITNTVSVIPATGDTILVAVGVMAISAAALVILLAVSKKRKKNK